jgi:molybdate transport system substrate-binding protein
MIKRFIVGLSAAGLLAILLLYLGDKDEETARRTELIVSAAASLQISLELLHTQYEASHPNIDLIFNYGSSGTLQQQIEQGAPVDVFLSAGQKQMDGLISKQFIDKSQTILKNELVVVVASDSKKDWPSIQTLTSDEISKIAIGQPESVPAGLYAQQALKTLGLWDSVQKKLVYAKDVQQVLNYVETGNAEAGFVYQTDAQHSKKSKIAEYIDSDTHQPIVYPAGILNNSKHPEEALAFYNYLTSKEAQSIFTDFGFKVP